MGEYCRDCRADLEHCHGTIIRHLMRRPECTEAGCAALEAIPHAYSVACDAVGCGCAQAQALLV